MKAVRLIAAAFSAVLAFSAMPAVNCFADQLEGAKDELTDGSFTYERTDKGYTITKCTAEIIKEIPAQANGTPIVAISAGAFMNKTAITELKIPDTVKSIGDQAFYGCSGLKSVQLPARLQSLGQAAFAGCTALESVNIPKTITEIPDNAFRQCEHLLDIELPDTITSIGDYAFYDCASLRTFTLPESLTEIGDMAMAMWFSMTDINADKCPEFTVENEMLMNKDKTAVYRGLTTIKGDVYIPETVKEVKSGAFFPCPEMEVLFIPASVSTIDDGAFAWCSNLKKIDFSEGLTSIGEQSFYFTGVETLSLPTTLISIGKEAFAYNEKLTKVIFSEGTENIGDAAFAICENLKTVSIPKSVKSIGENAFGYTVENGESAKVSGFKMSVFSGSAAEKYAKNNDIEFSAKDKDMKKVVFIVVAVALIAAVAVFSVVLMSRGKKGESKGTKKARKQADEQAEEDSYEKIIDDQE